MIDFLRAVFGTCAWCVDRPENWLERRFGGYKSESTAFGRVVWWLYTHGGLGLWRLGRWWHWKVHARKYRYKAIKKRVEREAGN